MSQKNLNLEIFVDQQDWNDEVRIFITGTAQNGNRFLAKPVDLVFEEKPGHLIAEPTFKVSGLMSKTFLPALRDAIIKAGYKDKQTDVEHIQNHLKDMQKIVFKQLGIS